MKYLIVNADDFGYSFGINKGIIEAHAKGIVTSTSVMVDGIASAEARDVAKLNDFSVGLHFVVNDLENVHNEFERQIEKFISIVGREPDHLDSHKSRPSAVKEVGDELLAYGKTYNIPVRSLGKAKLIESFFGLNIDGSGGLNEDNVSFTSLKRAIDEATDQYNELMCHPGYADEYLRKTSSYNDIREKELAALIDLDIQRYIAESGLTLSSWTRVAGK